MFIPDCQVSSTETGVVFGNIIWESGTNESSVVLNDIHIDIMDYIKPAYCNEAAVGLSRLLSCFEGCS